MGLRSKSACLNSNNSTAVLLQKRSKMQNAVMILTLWTGLKNVIHQTILDVFALKQGQDPDWYRDSRHALKLALEQKRKALLRLKSLPTRCALEEHRGAKAHAQNVCECVRAYLDYLCTRIETARDSGNIKEMFEGIKTATGPSIQTAGVLKKKDRGPRSKALQMD